jgi:heat-inducible transcriptional repressor
VLRREIETDEDYTQEELDHCAQYTNQHYSGQYLTDIRQHLLTEMVEEQLRYNRQLRAVKQLGSRAIGGQEEAELHFGRVTNILAQPEFAQAATDVLREILRAFEEKNKVVRILNKCLAGGTVHVAIGSELALPALEPFSLIASCYRRFDQILGTVGVIGPKRMPYPAMMSLVEYTADQLTYLLSRT